MGEQDRHRHNQPGGKNRAATIGPALTKKEGSSAGLSLAMGYSLTLLAE